MDCSNVPSTALHSPHAGPDIAHSTCTAYQDDQGDQRHGNRQHAGEPGHPRGRRRCMALSSTEHYAHEPLWLRSGSVVRLCHVAAVGDRESRTGSAGSAQKKAYGVCWVSACGGGASCCLGGAPGLPRRRSRRGRPPAATTPLPTAAATATATEQQAWALWPPCLCCLPSWMVPTNRCEEEAWSASPVAWHGICSGRACCTASRLVYTHATASSAHSRQLPRHVGQRTTLAPPPAHARPAASCSTCGRGRARPPLAAASLGARE